MRQVKQRKTNLLPLIVFIIIWNIVIPTYTSGNQPLVLSASFHLTVGKSITKTGDCYG